jgi:hypothetical protein
MTEPRVEAGDRALETARKICKQIRNWDFWTFCNSEPNPNAVKQVAALIQSAMNAQDKERLGTDWQELAEKNQETADKALALVDAMNAQGRELDQLLPDSLNRPMSERIQGLKERAEREATLAVELREALRRSYELCRIFAGKIPMLALSDRSYDQYSSALKELAEAERLLAERGEAQ